MPSAPTPLPFDAGFWALRASWGREPHLEAAFKTLAAHLLEDDARRRHQRARAPSAPRRHRAALASWRTSASRAARSPTTTASSSTCCRRSGSRSSCASSSSPRSCRASRRRTRSRYDADLPLGARRSRSPRSSPSCARRSRSAPSAADDAAAFDEQATYRPHGIDDYGRIETEILEPMEQAYELVREIGTGISHHWGAFG